MHAETAPIEPIAAGRAFEVERLLSGRLLVRDRTVAPEAARAAAPALEQAFARHDSLSVAVARRTMGGEVRAHGAFVVHPKGFHRAGRGAPADAERFDLEVDAADGGVCVFAAEAFEKSRAGTICDPCAGYGALGLLAATLEVRRLRLGRVIACAAATVEEPSAFDHMLEQEGFRNDLASSHARVHFGFDLEACDLDRVAEGSALRWNAPVWGAPAGFGKYDDRGAYHWELYRSHDAYRRRADTLVAFLAANLPAGPQPVLDVGAGDALFAGLLARQGVRVDAVDPEPRAVATAREALAREGLEALVSCSEGVAEHLPFPEHAFRGAMLLDVIEHLRNPQGALRELRRTLCRGATLLVATPAWRFGQRADPVYHLDEYREEELARAVRCAGFTIAQTARIKGAYDDIVLLARA
ncbi:MAG: class I SAM-dependent methyltransferase [Planctomycetota bacterium]